MPSQRKKRTLILFLVSALLLIPTGLLFTTPGRLLILNWNEAQWQRQALRHYRYTFKNVSFANANANALYEVVIEVDDDQTLSMTRKSDGTAVRMALFQDDNTIPKLFQKLHAMVEHNPRTYLAQYQPQTGIPVYVNIDFSSTTTDDGYVLTVTDFQVLSEADQ